MRQSNVIFGAIVFAFLVYITTRGQLPAYLGLFRSRGGSGGGGGNTVVATDFSPDVFDATDFLERLRKN